MTLSAPPTETPPSVTPSVSYRWRDRPASSSGRRSRPRSAPRSSRSRWDIQGLRAFAVLAVVANHVWGWPHGGFVGVDVFFVISGFLITGLLLREHDRTGHISFSGFYRRRAKRILPASVLVLLATVAASWFIFNPARWLATVVDGVWSLLFAANWRFALQSTDYFAQDRPISPLQHYWSLGVEEQFYLVWPWLMLLVLVLLGRAGKARPRAVLAVLITALSVASFVWALDETQVAANRAYFSTFSRAWELGVGALLAVAGPLVARLPGRLRPPLAWLGLAGMVAGVLLVSPSDGFPAPAAALPVLATALVIAAGTGVPQQRLLFPLTNRAAGYVGDISFSLYLWHFPVVILGRAVLGGGVLAGLFLLALATVASVYTYHLVEDPLRRSQWLLARPDRPRSRRRRHGRPTPSTWFSPAYQKTALSLLALATAVLVAVALQPLYRTATTTTTAVPLVPISVPSGSATKAATTAQDQLQAQIAQALTAKAWPTLSPSMSTVMSRGLGPDDIHACGSADTIDEASCTWGDPKAKHTMVVVGNSTAVVYADLLRKVVGNDRGWNVVSYGMYGCGFRDMEILGPPADAQKSCRQRPDDAVAAINRLDPDVVVLSGTGSVASADSEIRKITVKSKLVLLPGPPPDKDVNECYSKVSTPADCVSVPDPTWGVLETKVASDVGGVLVDPRKWFCVDARCPAFVGSLPVKLDRFHVTTEYNAFIAPVVREDLTTLGILRLRSA